jgi:hypothetical protein
VQMLETLRDTDPAHSRPQVIDIVIHSFRG